MSDKRHGDPEHGGLSSGEKAAITRQVHSGVQPEDINLPSHPEHAKAAREYAEEVAAKHEAEHGKAKGGHGHGHGHARGELSSGEKAAVTRAVHGNHPVEDLPFVQGHPKKLEKAKAYAEEVEEHGKA